jgi:hypothetical protein
METMPVHQDATKPILRSAPAMDVVPPRAADTIKTPPPIAQDSGGASSDAPKVPLHHQAAQAHTMHQPRQSQNGAGMAILATIIIVLGLGVLMLYAYLRTNGISVF